MAACGGPRPCVVWWVQFVDLASRRARDHPPPSPPTHPPCIVRVHAAAASCVFARACSCGACAVRCGAVRCGRCGLAGAVRCGAVRCGAVRCGAVWCGRAGGRVSSYAWWCGVRRSGVRCGAVRCGVVWWVCGRRRVPFCFLFLWFLLMSRAAASSSRVKRAARPLTHPPCVVYVRAAAASCVCARACSCGARAVQCGAVRCGAVRCGVVGPAGACCRMRRGAVCGGLVCGAVRCDAVRCGAVRCGAVRCGAVRCGAVRGGAVRCGVVWCGVVGVRSAACTVFSFRVVL